MEYNIKVTTDSLLLGAGAEARFVFYPHMRPFFHPLESYMDTAIFLRLVKLANQTLKDTMPEVTPPPTNTSFTSLGQKKSKNKVRYSPDQLTQAPASKLRRSGKGEESKDIGMCVSMHRE